VTTDISIRSGYDVLLDERDELRDEIATLISSQGGAR
jgi:hypothetical protein